MPVLPDLVASAMVVYCLWPGRRFGAWTFQSGRLAVWDAVSFLLFPLIAGYRCLPIWRRGKYLLCCSDYLSPLAGIHLELPCLEYAAGRVAGQEAVQKIAVMTVLVLSIGVLQDAFPHIQDPFRVLLSVGMTLTWTVLALRRRYIQSPLAATVAAAIVGGVSCMPAVMAPGDPMVPALLLPIAFLVGSLTLRSRRWWPRWVALASIAGAGLLFSWGFPGHFHPKTGQAFLTRNLRRCTVS